MNELETRDRLYKSMVMPNFEEIQFNVELGRPELKNDISFDFVSHFCSQFFAIQKEVKLDK